MKAVIFGTGRIGCGLAGQLLNASGYDLVFVGRSQAKIDHLNRLERYNVRLMDGLKAHEIVVRGLHAISVDETHKVASEIAQADLVVSSVGARNIPHVAPLIAAGLARRTTPVNVLAFENVANAGRFFRRLVAGSLSPGSLVEGCGFAGVVVSRIVPHAVYDPFQQHPPLFIGDLPRTFVVDSSSLRGPVPEIEGMELADNFIACELRKRYIFSTGHAATAYLGYLKGYCYIHEAIRDSEIRSSVMSLMAEAQRGLAARFGQECAGAQSDPSEIAGRFENVGLNDPIERVGRNPRCKLSTLLKAARMEDKAGISPEKLTLAMAAALHFWNPADPSANELQRAIATDGLAPTLREIMGADYRTGLGASVNELWHRLGDKRQNRVPPPVPCRGLEKELVSVR